MSGPLAGVRIIDLTSVVLGPYGTQILGDLGADVIKVESAQGDVMRHVGGGRNKGMSPAFIHANRNKRSLVLDLKQAAGRSALLRLAAKADVMVYNIRPQAMARLRIAYEDVRAVNAGIIYVGAFGFGQDGPNADKPAYDDLMQGVTGIAWLMQQSGSPEPRYAPLTLVDRIIGLNTVNAVTSALYHRSRTGVGQRVDVPMFETMAQFVLGDHMGGRTFEPPTGPVGYPRVLVPERRPYRTLDGYVSVLIYNDKQWQGFFRAIDREDILHTDPRFHPHENRAKHIGEVYAFVADTMATRTTDAWLELLTRADIPIMKMYSISDLIDDAHMAAVGFFSLDQHPSEGTIRQMRTPTRWSESPPAFRLHAPRLGQHSAEILREAGYGDDEIRALGAAGVTHNEL